MYPQSLPEGLMILSPHPPVASSAFEREQATCTVMIVCLQENEEASS